jgi:hypothetical protein
MAVDFLFASPTPSERLAAIVEAGTGDFADRVRLRLIHDDGFEECARAQTLRPR